MTRLTVARLGAVGPLWVVGLLGAVGLLCAGLGVVTRLGGAGGGGLPGLGVARLGDVGLLARLGVSGCDAGLRPLLEDDDESGGAAADGRDDDEVMFLTVALSI